MTTRNSTRTGGQVRRQVLAGHAVLRDELDDLEVVLQDFESGKTESGSRLRERGVRLFDLFAAHLGLEDEVLIGVLRRQESGESLAEMLTEEHREQRELLSFLLSRLEDDERPSSLVARELSSFVEVLRIDMAHEEATVLRTDLFQDS
jgi:hemerythrin-like domain-containing protein